MSRRKPVTEEPLEYRLDSILRIRPLKPATTTAGATTIPSTTPPPSSSSTHPPNLDSSSPTLPYSPRRLKSRRLSKQSSPATTSVDDYNANGTRTTGSHSRTPPPARSSPATTPKSRKSRKSLTLPSPTAVPKPHTAEKRQGSVPGSAPLRRSAGRDAVPGLTLRTPIASTSAPTSALSPSERTLATPRNRIASTIRRLDLAASASVTSPSASVVDSRSQALSDATPKVKPSSSSGSAPPTPSTLDPSISHPSYVQKQRQQENDHQPTLQQYHQRQQQQHDSKQNQSRKGSPSPLRKRVTNLVTRRNRSQEPILQPEFPREPKRLTERPQTTDPESLLPLPPSEFAPKSPFEHEPRPPPHELGTARRFGRTVPTRPHPTQKHAIRRALAEKPVFTKQRALPKVVPSIFEEDEDPEVNDIPSEVAHALPKPKTVLKEADVATRRERGKKVRAELVIASSTKADLPWAIIRIPSKGVPLCGFGWVSVLKGNVTIHGATLGTESPPLFFQSPVGTAIPVKPVESVPSPAPLNMERRTAEHHNEDADDHAALRESLSFELEGETTVILLTSTNRWSKTASASADLPFSLPLWSLPQHLVLLLPKLFIPHPETTPLEMPMCWDELTEAVRTPRAARILVLGTRGAGKSTLARSLVNHAVSTQPRGAMYLEADISRPDRSIYGLVAAHRVHHPSTTAMSACRDVPYCARLFGDLTPRDDPELFHQCQNTVGQKAISGAARERIPLICNTHGWMNGDGLRLIHELLELMQPTCVVIMQLKYRAPGDDGLDEVLSYLPSATRVIRTEPLPVPYRPMQHVVVERDMVIGSYFSNEMTLGRVRILQATRTAIVTEPGGRGGQLDGIGRYPLIGIVGNLVALGISPTGQWRREDDMQSIEMIGYAIVRGIDSDARKIFIATPMPAHLVKLVTCLVLPGSIETPVQVFARASAAVGWDRRRKDADGKATLPPFTLTGSVPNSAPMRSRTTLLRKAYGVGGSPKNDSGSGKAIDVSGGA